MQFWVLQMSTPPELLPEPAVPVPVDEAPPAVQKPPALTMPLQHIAAPPAPGATPLGTHWPVPLELLPATEVPLVPAVPRRPRPPWRWRPSLQRCS